MGLFQVRVICPVKKHLRSFQVLALNATNRDTSARLRQPTRLKTATLINFYELRPKDLHMHAWQTNKNNYSLSSASFDDDS